MQLKDKYGVPLEPKDEPLLYDWQEQPLYEGDECIEVPGGFVLNDNQEILKYIRQTHDIVYIGR